MSNNYIFDELMCDMYCSYCKRANLPMKVNVCELCIMTTENEKLETPFYFADCRAEVKKGDYE